MLWLTVSLFQSMIDRWASDEAAPMWRTYQRSELPPVGLRKEMEEQEGAYIPFGVCLH